MSEPSEPPSAPAPAPEESHRGEHNEIDYRIVDEEAEHGESAGPQDSDDRPSDAG